MEAAQKWVATIKGKTQKNKNAEIVRQLKFWKADKKIIERYERAAVDDELFPVLPENWTAVTLFQAVSSQWRVAPFGGLLGLDRQAIDIEIKYSRITVTPEDWEGLKIIEAVAVAEMRKKEA